MTPLELGKLNPLKPFSGTQDEAVDSSNELMDYIHILITAKWFILAVTLVAMVGSAVYQFRRPDVYQTTAEVMIERIGESTKLSSKMQPTQASSEADPDGADMYETWLQILKSNQIRQAVIRELGGEDPGFSLSAIRVRRTSIISLTVRSTQQDWVEPIASKYVEIFTRENSNQSLFINEQLLRYIPDDIDIGRDMREDLLKETRGQTVENSLTDAFNKNSFNKDLFAESIDLITEDKTIIRLRDEKTEFENSLIALTERYRPNHPDVVMVQQKLDSTNAKIKARSKVLLNQLKATLAGQMKISNIRIIQPPSTPTSPSGPDRQEGMLVVTIIGFVVACGLVLVYDSFNPKIRSQKDLKSITLVYLGNIPFVNRLKGNNIVSPTSSLQSLVNAVEANVQLADAIVNIRTHILFSIAYEKSKRMMITSALPGEGKTTVSVLLALSFAALGRKILLIDADLRKPAVEKYLNIKTEFGLSDYLLGISSLDEMAYAIPGHSLSVVSAGHTRVQHVPELLDSHHFSQLLDEAQSKYDRVIVDVPPALYIPDGLIVAKHIQAAFLVCGSGMTFKKAVRTVKEKFDHVGMPLSGLIINKTDAKHEGYYGKKYYSKYYSDAPASPVAKPGAVRLARWGFADKPKNPDSPPGP